MGPEQRPAWQQRAAGGPVRTGGAGCRVPRTSWVNVPQKAQPPPPRLPCRADLKQQRRAAPSCQASVTCPPAELQRGAWRWGCPLTKPPGREARGRHPARLDCAVTRQKSWRLAEKFPVGQGGRRGQGGAGTLGAYSSKARNYIHHPVQSAQPTEGSIKMRVIITTDHFFSGEHSPSSK